ncbi:MAG: phosphotransferase [Actinomycetota bacterium]|nr:phosphotransferase [Actinomycetota bacterium]
MSLQWEPERAITLDDARALVRDQCPDFTFSTSRILAAGWDNTVVLFDDSWVFRFPRRAIALPGIEREIDWLPWIADQVELRVPVPMFIGDYDGWPFWGGRHLAGQELAHRPDVDRVPVAAAVGRFLACLHGTELPHSALFGKLPVDPFGRADSATRSKRASGVLAELIELGLWEEDPSTRAILGAGSELGPVSGNPVLSHGDLYSRHVLVDRGGEVSGIIDWGDLCMAVPAVDLAIAFSAFTGEARAALFESYGVIDAEAELRARTFAIFSAASVAHYAHDVADPVLLAEALAGLRGVAT